MQVISVNKGYASASRRLAAFFIDAIILSVIVKIIFLRSWVSPWDAQWNFFSFDWEFFRNNLPSEIFVILYYTLMESSKYQATLGKIALGIKVVDTANQGLTFAKALLRTLSKLISGALLAIGYIMIIFDERKQGLHDKIADTFVVKQ